MRGVRTQMMPSSTGIPKSRNDKWNMKTLLAVSPGGFLTDKEDLM